MKIGRLLAAVLSFVLLSVSFIYSDTCNVPFPQGQDYPYGLRPNNYTQAEMNQHVQDWFDKWRAKYVVNTNCDPGEWRVERVETGNSITNGCSEQDTVSEGIGYGMVVMVYMSSATNNTKQYFDGMLAYYKRNADGNGLMNWQIPYCNSGGAATDADEDVAAALLMADAQWGSGGAINYAAEAQTIINAILANEITANNDIRPGDGWDGGNISYFAPYEYRMFGDFTGNTRWYSVASRTYNTMVNYYMNSSLTYDSTLGVYTGLMPNWSDYDGTPWSPGAWCMRDNTWWWDAIRHPWRQGYDYVLYGTLNHQYAKDAPKRISEYFKLKYSGDPTQILSHYELDGTETTYCRGDRTPDLCDEDVMSLPGPVGAVAVAAMAGDDQVWLNSLYDWLVTMDANKVDGMDIPGSLTDTGTQWGTDYFCDLLKMQYLLVLTGNMPNPNGNYPTETPTDTWDPLIDTYTPTPTPEPGFFDDFESGSLTNLEFPAGQAGFASVDTATDRAAAGTYSVKITANGNGWGGFGIDSPTAIGGYHDYTGATAVEFDIYSTVGITFFVKIQEAVANGADGEDWSVRGNQETITANGWRHVSIPLSAFTRDQYTAVYGDNIFSYSGIKQFFFQIDATANSQIWIDNIEFTGNFPTSTPTETPIETDTFTVTMTDTETPDPLWTDTETPIPTETFTETETFTVTETHTPAPLPVATAGCGTAASIDGDLSDAIWQAGTWTYIDNIVDGTNPDNVSARFKLYWDSSSLYVAVEVTDGVLINDSAEVYNDDSVELYFDMGNEGSAAYDANDAQYQYGYEEDVLYMNGNLSATGVIAAQAVIAGGWTAEFEFPWSALGISTPSEMDVFGFDVGLNFDQITGGGRDGVLMWQGNNNNWQNTSAFGELFLGSCAPPTETPTDTSTATGTATYTDTWTETATETFTNTVTDTETPTETATAVDTDTVTPTETQTDIPIDTQTDTPTETFTETFTDTVTDTPSETPTGPPPSTWTYTETFTDTVTGTPTDTETETPADTLTETFTETETETTADTVTQTYTETDTFTETETDTITETPTETETFTVTPTFTAGACPCLATAGRTTVGTSTYSPAGELDAHFVGLVQDGTIEEISVYVVSQTGGNISVALYESSGGVPAAIITESAPQTAVDGWNTIDVPDVFLSAGSYWLAVQVGAGTVLAYETGMDYSNAYTSLAFSQPFPASFPAGSFANSALSINFSYCPSSCVPVDTPTPVPVCACEDEMGTKYQASYTLNIGSYDIILSNAYLMSEDGDTSSMDVYVASGSGNARVAIYSNDPVNGNTPDMLLAESALSPVAVGWNNIAIPQIRLNAGMIYWLSIKTDAAVTLAVDGGTAGDALFHISPIGEPFPAALPWYGSSNDALVSMNVNYCPLVCPTDTDTPTETETMTETQTNTPTYTVTDTDTCTCVDTWTFTPTQTETETSADTETPIETETATETETQVFTETFTATSTPTLFVQITNIFPSTITVGTDTSTDVFFGNTDALTSVTINLLTSAMAPVDSYTIISAFAPGSNIIALALDNSATGIDFSSVPAGSYYITVDVTDGTYTGTSNAFLITVASAAPTFTFTRTPTETYTYTITDTPTFTFTNTSTFTFTYTQTETSTGIDTFTQTPTWTETSAVTETFTPTPIPTDSDTLEITEVMPYPNPFNPGVYPEVRFKCKVSQRDVESIAIRIYTAGYRLIKEKVFAEAAMTQIINREYIAYEAEDLAQLANGTYYYYILVKGKDGEARSKVDKFIILK